MNPKLLLTVLFITTSTLLGQAQDARYFSITAAGGNSPATNQYSITEFETASVVYGYPTYPYGNIKIAYEKDGITFDGPNGGTGIVVKGPATFTVISVAGGYAIVTLKITPEAFDPNKTLILPPGTNQVAVTMETSTNLVSWGTATNGIYGSPDTARFFRVRMEKLN